MCVNVREWSSLWVAQLLELALHESRHGGVLTQRLGLPEGFRCQLAYFGCLSQLPGGTALVGSGLPDGRERSTVGSPGLTLASFHQPLEHS